MINNKKGLSAIVTTLLVILLVLVAVGIVWGVVSGIFKQGEDTSDVALKCLYTDISATAVDCSAPGACDVTFERTGTEDEAIAGVKLVFRDSTDSANSAVIEVAGDIAKLVGKTETDVDSTLVAPDSVDVTVFFEDGSGNEQLCFGTNTFTF